MVRTRLLVSSLWHAVWSTCLCRQPSYQAFSLVLVPDRLVQLCHWSACSQGKVRWMPEIMPRLLQCRLHHSAWEDTGREEVSVPHFLEADWCSHQAQVSKHIL